MIWANFRVLAMSSNLNTIIMSCALVHGTQIKSTEKKHKYVRDKEWSKNGKIGRAVDNFL